MADIDINPALPTWPTRRDPERDPRREPEEPTRAPAQEPAAEPAPAAPPLHEEGEPGANVDEYARRCAL